MEGYISDWWHSWYGIRWLLYALLRLQTVHNETEYQKSSWMDLDHILRFSSRGLSQLDPINGLWMRSTLHSTFKSQWNVPWKLMENQARKQEKSTHNLATWLIRNDRKTVQVHYSALNAVCVSNWMNEGLLEIRKYATPEFAVVRWMFMFPIM